MLGRDFAVFAEESQPSFAFFLQFFFRALALQGFGFFNDLLSLEQLGVESSFALRLFILKFLEKLSDFFVSWSWSGGWLEDS